MIDRLADYAHESWSGWMRYLFKLSTKNADGSVTIPVELVMRWERQIATNYYDLPDNEQESDRKEARKIVALVADELEKIK